MFSTLHFTPSPPKRSIVGKVYFFSNFFSLRGHALLHKGLFFERPMSQLIKRRKDGTYWRPRLTMHNDYDQKISFRNYQTHFSLCWSLVGGDIGFEDLDPLWFYVKFECHAPCGRRLGLSEARSSQVGGQHLVKNYATSVFSPTSIVSSFQQFLPLRHFEYLGSWSTYYVG